MKATGRRHQERIARILHTSITIPGNGLRQDTSRMIRPPKNVTDCANTRCSLMAEAEVATRRLFIIKEGA
jgi:hypothetical protein